MGQSCSSSRPSFAAASAQPAAVRRTTPHDEDAARLPDGSIIDEDDDDVEDAVLPSVSESTLEQLEKDGLSESHLSVYRQPCTPEEAAAQYPAGGGGLIYHAQLLNIGFAKEWLKAFNKKFTSDKGVIKPRRALPPVLADDFFASLVRTADGRWMFSGVLNGWPALRCLELTSLTFVSFKNRTKVKRVWSAGAGVEAPRMPDEGSVGSVRATLVAPPWSATGYGPDATGFVWWFMAQRTPNKLLVYGENILKEIPRESPPQAVRVHMFAHRYARLKPETVKDRLTYHAAILLEWDHGQYCTVVELATLHGVGGRNGKSNWFDDKGAALRDCLPPDMVAPWKGEYAEVRCSDVPAKTLDEFKEHMCRYEGKGKDARFVDVHYVHSGPVRLYHRSQADIARYLLNYSGRDRRYTEKVRNCQAFAADFYAFAAGKKGIEVFSSYLRPMYTQRTHLFLYDPSLYQNPLERKKK